jgi:hypothetical protein
MNYFFIDSRIFEVFRVKYTNEDMRFRLQYCENPALNVKLAPRASSKAHLIS